MPIHTDSTTAAAAFFSNSPAVCLTGTPPTPPPPPQPKHTLYQLHWEHTPTCPNAPPPPSSVQSPSLEDWAAIIERSSVYRSTLPIGFWINGIIFLIKRDGADEGGGGTGDGRGGEGWGASQGL